MKSDDYYTILIFKEGQLEVSSQDLDGGDYVPAPSSRCECPAGLHFCSHMGTEYAVLYLCQVYLYTISKQDLMAALPVPLRSIKSEPIPWAFTFSENNIEKGLKQIQQKRKRKRIASLFVSLDFLDGVEDDNETQGVAPEVDADDNEDGSDDKGVVLLEDDEEDGFDKMEEVIAGTEEVESTTKDSLPICSFADDMVKEAKLRQEVSSSNKQYEQKYEKCKIREKLQSILAGVGGPNESVASKIAQLEVHNRLDQCFKTGNLEQNNMLHYLAATRKRHQIQVNQLYEIRSHGLQKGDESVNWVPERLAKLPPGHECLADRGFLDCAHFYPHLNAQITPFFLSGRSQFAEGELTAHRDKCEARYSLEASFSRVSDNVAFHDKIPRRCFVYLQHAVDWAIVEWQISTSHSTTQRGSVSITQQLRRKTRPRSANVTTTTNR